MPGIYKVHYTCRGQKETRTVVVKEGAASQQLGARAQIASDPSLFPPRPLHAPR